MIKVVKFLAIVGNISYRYVVFKNADTIGIKEGNIELIENVKLYVYMYNSFESGFIMSDELVLTPIIN